MNVFTEFKSFTERYDLPLPTPAEIRAINKETGNVRATDFYRPPPVMFPSLGLTVKYGADVTLVEAQTQRMLHRTLQGQVPIPEVFGWVEDEGQGFIYMSFIEGETLQERWGSTNEDERRGVCVELKHMVKTWRALEQNQKYKHYIGNLDQRPLNDIFLSNSPKFTGPFRGEDAVQQFHDACGIEISNSSGDNNMPIVFTHADFVAPNILLSPGPNPKVAAIIDWAQSGWYPAYWEYSKARRVRLVSKCFDDTIQEEWRTKYLPMILDPVDDETVYYPWLYFVLFKGI